VQKNIPSCKLLRDIRKGIEVLDALEALVKIDRPRALELINEAFREVKEINGGKGVYEIALPQLAKRSMRARHKSYETGKRLNATQSAYWRSGRAA
jgi:hypothetical protein